MQARSPLGVAKLEPSPRFCVLGRGQTVESDCNIVRSTRRTEVHAHLSSCASVVTGTTGDSKDAHDARHVIQDTFRGDRAAIGEHADTCASERTSRGVDQIATAEGPSKFL